MVKPTAQNFWAVGFINQITELNLIKSTQRFNSTH